MQQVKDKVIVLRTIKYSEADLIVHGMNTQGARISFLAKSALKSRKRFGGGVLEPTHYIEVMYKKRSAASEFDGLHILNDAKLLESFDGIRKDYSRLEMALYFLKVMSKASQEGAIEDRAHFLLLGQSLRALESGKDLLTLKTVFELKLLNAHGVLPPDVQGHRYLRSPVAKYESHSLTRQENQALRGRVHHILGQYLHI